MIKAKATLRQRFTPMSGATRRQFLGKMALGSAAATVGTLAMPGVSRAQTVVWRFQSSWPQKDIFHELAHDYVQRVNSMAGNRLKLELLPAGAVVGAFQIQDAVYSGALEGGHAAVAYWYGKHKAFSMFGTSPPWGWDANMLLGWFYDGGGDALYRELVNDMIKVNVISFLSGPQPTQPLGWFKKEIHSVQDIKGLKYRTIGLAADLMAEMGAAVTILPGGDIVPAMDRGVLDGAELQITRLPTACSVSRMSPRSTCCKAGISARKPSKSCSTSRNTTRCRRSIRRSSAMPPSPPRLIFHGRTRTVIPAILRKW